jgi:organic radical activating enzyme
MIDQEKQKTYPLASQGVYRSVLGEGDLLGQPAVIIRLAGCPVNCPECDTDYRVTEHASLRDIVTRIDRLVYNGGEWVWVSGGEPASYDLVPLFVAIRERLRGVRIAVATSGVGRIPWGVKDGCNFLSVSPHSIDGWTQRSGSAINLVPGLNGLRLRDFIDVESEIRQSFASCWVTPCDGKPETLKECLNWVNCHPGWRLGAQGHKLWGLP